MDTCTPLTFLLHVMLLLILTSAGSIRQRGRCEYIQVSDWSDCDLLTMTSTRSLELLSGDTGICNKNKVESRDCGERDDDENRTKDNIRRHQLNKRKRLKRKKKKIYLQSDCKYNKSKWSSCDWEKQTQTLVETLVSESATECEPRIILTRACLPKLEMLEAEEGNTGSEVRKGRKNSVEEHKRKKKQKNQKKMELKKNKTKINDKNSSELSNGPPPSPTELHVEPHATFAVVTWQPPKRDGFIEQVPVNSYKIGYGQGFPDLHTLQVSGKEVSHRIQNLEPGKEYIVSLRAKTIWGVSQPLYETIRTRSAAEEQMLLSPVDVRPMVLSSEAISVSWVDMNGEVGSRKREYYLRYRQLNHLSSSTSEQSHFEVQHTSDTHMVVSGLQPFTKYEFAVMVSDGERNSSWSGMTWNVTQEAEHMSQLSSKDLVTVPDVSPAHEEDEAVRLQIEPARKLHANILSSTSAAVTWQDPGFLETFEDISRDPDMSSPESTYTVRYCSLDKKLRNYTVISSPFTTLYVADLMPLTWYEFMVKIHRSNQESEWSLPVKNRTLAADDKASGGLRQPENLQVTVMSSNSALISWHDPDLPKDKERHKSEKPASHSYTLRYRDVNRKSSSYKFASPTLPLIFMVDLEAATRYEFSVRTDMGDQHSDWSSPVVNMTFESAPSTGPSHVTVLADDGDPTTALLKWQPPEFPNGDITGYIVFYETATERKSAAVPAGELFYRIPFLKPHTKYVFRIGARNSQGFSPLSNRVVYRTPRVVGMPPTDVTVTPASDDLYNAIVSWQPPSPNKRKIKFYTVTHYTEDGKQRAVVKVPGFTLTTVVKKLLPSTVYHFTVQAHYQRGSGPHSATVKYSIPKRVTEM